MKKAFHVFIVYFDPVFFIISACIQCKVIDGLFYIFKKFSGYFNSYVQNIPPFMCTVATGD